IDGLLGDFGGVIADNQPGVYLPDVSGSIEAFRDGILGALAFQHDNPAVRAGLRMLPALPQSDVYDRVTRIDGLFSAYLGLQNWQALVAIDPAVEKAQWEGLPTQDNEALIQAGFRPWLALAKAELGDIPSADAVIAKTPRDCYDCVRVRGTIAALAHRFGAA